MSLRTMMSIVLASLIVAPTMNLTMGDSCTFTILYSTYLEQSAPDLECEILVLFNIVLLEYFSSSIPPLL